MIRVVTPATSANLGVGFDSFSLALALYNSFIAYETKEFEVSGFEEEFNTTDNQVMASYMAFSKEFLEDEQIKKIHIKLEQNHIPISRGLGSSASVILAGVLIANEINKLGKSMFECACFASQLEGHPDNVFGCAFGGFTSVVTLKHGYHYNTFPVSDDLVFTALIPSIKGSTKTLRNVLPERVLLQDAVHHLSRTIHVPQALKTGDMPLLKELLDDKLHETYRYHTIPYVEEVLKLKEKEELVVLISGSGPTVLVISNVPVFSISEKISHVEYAILQVSQGAVVEVIK